MFSRNSNQSDTQSPGKTGLVIQRRFALGIAATFLFAAIGVWALSPQDEAERRPLGLMSTLPIYWGEAAGMDELIGGTAQPHWVRGTLEREFDLIPVDNLAEARELAQDDGLTWLLLAQPRALSGPENVALDKWVRGGGQLLLFADPMLTGHSRFSIGDRRRPQDVILLSPILSRWGLSLHFDEAQLAGEREVDYDGMALPVDLAGTFRLVATDPGAPAQCKLAADKVVADCAIGQGRALIVSDAALLDQDAGGTARENAARPDRPGVPETLKGKWGFRGTRVPHPR